MQRIAIKVILGIALALSLIGSAFAANWNSDQDPKPPTPTAVNWSK